MKKYLWLIVQQPGSSWPSLCLSICLLVCFFTIFGKFLFVCLLEPLSGNTVSWKYTGISSCQRKQPSWELAWGVLQESLPCFHSLERRTQLETFGVEMVAVSHSLYNYWPQDIQLNAYMVVRSSCRPTGGALLIAMKVCLSLCLTQGA